MSDASGNYERGLENSPAAALASDGHASARDVARLIIDSAYRSAAASTAVAAHPRSLLGRARRKSSNG